MIAKRDPTSISKGDFVGRKPEKTKGMIPTTRWASNPERPFYSQTLYQDR